jgi:hypothetical protein
VLSSSSALIGKFILSMWVRAGDKPATLSSARFLCTQIFMGKQTKTVHKKSRGRPAGVRYGETIPTRFEPETVKAIDSWAAWAGVSRSQAIRRLVELGLKKKGQGNI